MRDQGLGIHSQGLTISEAVFLTPYSRRLGRNVVAVRQHEARHEDGSEGCEPDASSTTPEHDYSGVMGYRPPGTAWGRESECKADAGCAARRGTVQRFDSLR
jgi:hypothetical protein